MLAGHKFTQQYLNRLQAVGGEISRQLKDGAVAHTIITGFKRAK